MANDWFLNTLTGMVDGFDPSATTGASYPAFLIGELAWDPTIQLFRVGFRVSGFVNKLRVLGSLIRAWAWGGRLPVEGFKLRRFCCSAGPRSAAPGCIPSLLIFYIV